MDKSVSVSNMNNLDIKNIESDIKLNHEEISHTKTPKNMVKRRADGFDYVEEGWMRQRLNELFPIWSWTKGKYEFLGSEWVIVSGELQIIDKGGVLRKFASHGGARVQFKKGAPHSPENVVDIDKNIASANTNAFKRAVNRLCNIADDIYHKEFFSPLDEKQKDELIILSSKCGIEKETEIRDAIEKEKLHKANFLLAKAKLNRLIKQKGDN